MSEPHIGTLRERSLHASLKDWYAQPGDRREVKVGGFVVDLVRDDLLIEIQTRSFAPLKRKLGRLTEDYHVQLVHPIAAERWIVKLGPDAQTVLGRRKSPRRGRVEHIFLQLVSIPQLIERENFSLDVLLTREEEIRCHDGRGSWRRGGWSILDRRLLEVVRRVTLTTPADFAALLPADLPQPFTNRELARTLGLSDSLARKMTYCLRVMGVLQQVGKRGNAYLFEQLH